MLRVCVGSLLPVLARRADSFSPALSRQCSPFRCLRRSASRCIRMWCPIRISRPTKRLCRATRTRKLLLEADQLIYDFDAQTITAIGNVQIYYDRYTLDAEKIVYDEKSGRLIATGGVRMLEPNGNIITTEQLDITDDFRDAFIGSLNVVTIDQARFSAQTAERRDANLTIFRRGIYTACKPCLEHPERPPLWQIKAARIIHNEAEHTIYYENARLEFLGIPIAYVPYFFQPDPSVRRKTGFLAPSLLQSDSIGVGVTHPLLLEPCAELRRDFLAYAPEPAGTAHAGPVAPPATQRCLRDPRGGDIPAGSGGVRGQRRTA